MPHEELIKIVEMMSMRREREDSLDFKMRKKGKHASYHSIKVLLNMCLTNEFQPKNIFSPLSYNWSAPKSLFRCKETRELLSQGKIGFKMRQNSVDSEN